MNQKGDHSAWTYVHGPKDQNALWGCFTSVSFVVVWVASLVVPFFCVILLCLGHARLSLALAATIAAAYVPWPKSPSMRRFFNTGFLRHFKHCSLLYEEPVVKPAGEPPALLCVHPHGIFCMGWGTLFSRPELDEVQFCFSPALYGSPFFRMFTKITGSPQPADKATFRELMGQRKPLALIPGGFEEATISHSGAHRVFCKTRMGFVKYALQHGYSLMPCYCFGENTTYSNLQGGWGIRFWLNAQGLPAILPFGQWWCPLLPKGNAMHIVVGKGVQLPLVAAPTHAQVCSWHAQYVASLQALFDRHKGSYGEGESKLEVW